MTDFYFPGFLDPAFRDALAQLPASDKEPQAQTVDALRPVKEVDASQGSNPESDQSGPQNQS
jgi:hypothetical protein